MRAEIVSDAATYSLLSGDPLTVHHYGTEEGPGRVFDGTPSRRTP
ncbi:hypothetical protein [Streptomyces albidoflavus]